MTNEQIAELREAAEKAAVGYYVPEAWQEARNYPDSEIACIEFWNTADPETVLALLDHLAKMEAERGEKK